VSEELEEPDYEVTASHSGFEVRRYSDTIQARVRTEGTNWRGSSGGFRRIAGYIFGRNEREQMIAMTAPVHIWEEGDGTMMAFTMPSEYSMEDLPSPNDSGVHLVNASGRSFAALKFTGLSGTRKTERLKKRLMGLLSKNGLAASGPAMLAVYDNPNTTLPFLRRNEILIPIHD
tara:strand:- start:456 stop:977 length:522 start_codon:yes stop_codon:yes gene_type:complete